MIKYDKSGLLWISTNISYLMCVTLPKCGKRLKDTGIIRPKIMAVLMCRAGAIIIGFLLTNSALKHWQQSSRFHTTKTFKSQLVKWKANHFDLYLLRRASSKVGTAAVVPKRAALERAVSFMACDQHKEYIFKQFKDKQLRWHKVLLQSYLRTSCLWDSNRIAVRIKHSYAIISLFTSYHHYTECSKTG